ncbi:MAG: UDP-N-acetylmuramate dehydrogenase [Oscillospiraceae bacterium]|jgi:UDP-N-acetylmuramate dehydrogenase|nr:UDP-N-acetylmuramate dehydrogenase [Oscillospiraceae bacterium]
MLLTDSFKRVVSQADCEAVYDAPMREYTSFKVGGNADLLITPNSEQVLSGILRAARAIGVPVTIIGNGSNLLVSDNGVRGVVIRTAGGLLDLRCEGNFIHCAAGVSLKRVCLAALEHSLTGLEFAYGIPASVGGALYMNAGAYCGEMKDVVFSARYINEELAPEEAALPDLQLSYRHSVFSGSECVITSVTLRLERGDAAAIREKMDDFMGRRKEKQPLEFPSAGSTFKRPEGHFAGALIDQCGLKGFAVGGAQVSEKHAGFIINRGGATAEDILRLIEHVKATVYAEKGVMLEPEVRMLGF